MPLNRSDYLNILYGKFGNSINAQNINNLGSNSSYEALTIHNNEAIRKAKSQIKEQPKNDRNWWTDFVDTVQDISSSIVQGIFGFVDSVSDFVINTAGEVGSWFGADKEWAKNATGFDWVSPVVRTTNIAGDFVAGRWFDDDYWRAENFNIEGSQDYLNTIHENSYLNNLGTGTADFISGLGQSIGFQIPSLVLAGLTGGGSVVAMGSMGVGALASQTNESYNETGDYGRSLASGLASGLVEVGTELVGGKILKGIGLGTGKVMGVFGKEAVSETTESAIKTLGKTMLEEGFEEFLSGALQPVVNSIAKGESAFYNEQGKSVYLDPNFWVSGNDSVLMQGLSGALVGGIFGGINQQVMKSALGQDGTQFAYSMEKVGDLQKQIDSTRNETKRQELSEEMAIELAKARTYLERVNQNANSTQKQNVLRFITSPSEVINALKSNTNANIDTLINNKISELGNINQFRARNFFNDLQSEFNTDFELVFDNANNQNAYVDNVNQVIHLNENLASDYAPILVHEYLGHIIGDLIPNSNVNDIFNSIKDTSWYNTHYNELYNSYMNDENAQNLINEQDKQAYYQKEVVNKYVENAFSNNSNTSIRTIRELLNRESKVQKFLNRLLNRSYATMLENDAVIKEFARQIDKVLNVLNGSNSNVVAKFLSNETLTEKEQKIVDKYKSFFDDLNRVVPSVEYSKNVERSKRQNYNEISYERTDEFRRLQERSKQLLKEFENSDTTYQNLDESIRERYTRSIRQALESGRDSGTYDFRLLKSSKNSSFNITNNVNQQLFHDAFETIKPYLRQNELVDLHDNYQDCKCFLSDDGLQGFAIEPNGNLVSVFNADESKRGFVEAISDYVKEQGATHLDCYGYLAKYYNKVLGFKVASLMEYNMEYDHHNIAERYNNPGVAFMVNTNENVETRHFNKNQYDEAQAYQLSFVRSKKPRFEYSRIIEPPSTEKATTNAEVDNLTQLETNEARRVKDITDNSLNSVITLKDTKAIYNRVLDKIKSDFGIDLKVSNKSQKMRRLFDDFNLMNREFTQTNISRFVEDILNQNIQGFENITYRQFLVSRNINVEDYVKSNTNLLFNLLIDNSNESATMKRFVRLFNGLKEARDNLLATNQFLRNNGSTIRSLENRIKNYASDTKEVKGALNTLKSYLSHIRFTKQGVLSSSALKYIHEAYNNGTLENMIKNILNPYQDILEVRNLTPQAETLLSMAQGLSESYVSGESLNASQILQIADLTRGIKKLYEDFNTGVIESARKEATKLIETAKATKEVYKHADNKFISLANRLLLDYASPKTMFSFIFGGTNTEAFNNVYEELYKKPYERQIKEYNKFKSEMLENTKELQKRRFAKVKGAKFRKYVLYQLYLNKLSPDNLERLQNATLSYTERKGVVRQFKYEDINKLLEENLSETEIQELDYIFKFYNTKLKNYVEKTSEKILGFATSRENYYPIVSSDAFRTTDFSNPANMRYNISAMNNNRLKSLTNRKTHIEINVDPINLFDDYVESMTITGEIGLESQKLNRLFQLKDENGDTLLTTISSYLPNAKTFVGSAFNKLIGNTQVIERSGAVDKLLGRYAVATLGFKPKTILKQIGSLFTATRYTGGIFNSIKTILRPTTYYRIYKNRTWLKQNNAVFLNRINNDGFVRGMTLSAGAMEFGSSIFQRLSKFSMWGIEHMDRLVCYTTFAFAQDFVKAKYGYGINTEENLNKANEIFTDILLDTQSNSDRIAMSRLRAGEEGNFMKNVFSLFGSDNQQKASILMQDIINFKNIRNNKSYSESTKKGLMTKTWKYIRTDVGAIVAGSILVAMINMLIDWLYDKEEPETYDYSKIGIDMLQSMFEWTPYFGTIMNWFVYGGLEYAPVENLNELVSTCSQLIDNSNGAKQFDKQIISNLVDKILNLMGIPYKNLKDLLLGVISNFSPRVAFETRNVIYGMSQSYLNSQYQQGKEQNNFSKMLDSFSMNSVLYKATLSDTNAKEIVRLKKADLQINAYNVPETYIDKNGEEIKLTEEQRNNFKIKYDNVDGLLSKIISSSTYKLLTDEQKASMINKAYQTYYEYALGRLGTKMSYLVGLNGIDLSRIILATNENNNLRLSNDEKLLVKFASGKSLSEEDRHALYLIFVRYGMSQATAKELLDL